jgi:cyclopropane-fatty-acyl-phospholipid synthase
MSCDDVQSARSGALRRTPARRLAAEPLASAVLRRLLRPFDTGTLTITLPLGGKIEHHGARPGPNARLDLKRWRALRRVIVGGDIGFAEAYMDGDWSTPDLVALLDCFQRNETALQAAWQGLSLSRLAMRLHHAARANTPRGSRRNIEAHYDLGNAFYKSWLDDGMNYSSALYLHPTQSLEEAQIAKLDRAISLLDVRPGDQVLEIGCGWGALAERLAVGHGCNVTGITLSHEQLAYAQARMRHSGCDEAVAIRLQDYRHTSGTFDAIVSIEMLEAAGEAYWPTYFEKLKGCLAPGGTAVLQVITIDKKSFAEYQRRPDFIQRYIFPGGMLPTVTHVAHHVEAAGLRLRSRDMFGESYARTLADWRARYEKARPPADAPHLGSERFKRMWRYYLAYCEVGFRTGVLDVGLYRITHR